MIIENIFRLCVVVAGGYLVIRKARAAKSAVAAYNYAACLRSFGPLKLASLAEQAFRIAADGFSGSPGGVKWR